MPKKKPKQTRSKQKRQKTREVKRNELIGGIIFDNIRNWFVNTAIETTPMPMMQKGLNPRVINKKTGKWEKVNLIPRAAWKYAGVPDEMLGDDGGEAAIEVMEGQGYKRRVDKWKSNRNMGGVAVKVAIRQAAKQAARQVAKGVTKQSGKRLAIPVAKELGKGAAVAVVGMGADAAISKMRGGGRKRRKRQRKH